jgi:hypothetical protein
MTTFEQLTIALQALVAVAAFATLGFLYHQVRVMVNQIIATQEATRAQSALALANFLQSPEVRSARQCVRSNLSRKHHSEWTDDEKRQASVVCANYDVAAGLLRANLAPTDLFVANWGPSIAHCHQVLSPYMADLRSKPGGHPSYWTNFDWLFRQTSTGQ